MQSDESPATVSPWDATQRGFTTLAISLVIAAAIVGSSLPDTPRTPKYEGFVVDDKVVRLDTSNGNIVACDFERCVRVLGNGKELASNGEPGLISSERADATARIAPAERALPQASSPKAEASNRQP